MSTTTKHVTLVERAVAKVSEVKEGTMKTVAFGVGKVLLANVKGKIYATSFKCTHYGAQLTAGVMSSDGRITCPWHGACFDVTTGDIEDAPALDNLCKFKVTVKGEDIYVEADEEVVKSARRIPVCATSVNPEDTNTVVIIGGGAGGNAAAEKLREDGFTGRVIVVSKEPYLPVDRPKLSKTLGQTAEKVALRSSKFYDDLFITFKLGVGATHVDTTDQTVTLDNGEKIKYNSLILSPGTIPRSIPIPGINLENVLYLRSVHDNTTLAEAVGSGEPKKNVVIIGSSFIGMELASLLIKKANVSVIGMEKVPFERVLGEKIGAALQKLHEKNGVKFHLSAGVKAIEASESASTKASAVVLADGTKIPADFVIVGAGVAPATEFLKSSPGFNLEKDGSLLVDSHFRVQGLQNVYAIGDIAKFRYRTTGDMIRIEHWGYAENTGRTAASAIANKSPTPFMKTPYFWSSQHGKNIRYAGYGAGFDDVIVHGNPDELTFAAYYTRGNSVLAVATLGKDPLASHCAELMHLGKLPTADEIRNGKNPLELSL